MKWLLDIFAFCVGFGLAFTVLILAPHRSGLLVVSLVLLGFGIAGSVSYVLSRI